MTFRTTILLSACLCLFAAAPAIACEGRGPSGAALSEGEGGEPEEPNVERDPAKGEEVYLEGLRARADDDFERAIELFERAGRLGFSRGWKDAATTNVKIGRVDAAIAACDRYLEDDPEGRYAATIKRLRASLERQRDAGD